MQRERCDEPGAGAGQAVRSPTGVKLISLSAWLHTCSMQRIPRLSVPVAQLTSANPTPALQNSP